GRQLRLVAGIRSGGDSTAAEHDAGGRHCQPCPALHPYPRKTRPSARTSARTYPGQVRRATTIKYGLPLRTSDGRRRGGPGVSRDGGPRRRADRVDKGEGRVGEGNAEGGEIGVGQVEPFDPPGPDRIEAVPEKFGGRGRAAVDPHD